MSVAPRPNTPTARAMFFTVCSPRSAKASDSLSLIWSLAAREMHSPPGSHSASRRAAMFTPSPKMSSPSMMMSPRLMPIRNTIRLSSGSSALRVAIARWIATAQATASTTLANSTSAPSPVVFTIRPRCAAICGSTSSRRCAFRRASVPTSSAPMRRL
jgi:hypothetical protein